MSEERKQFILNLLSPQTIKAELFDETKQEGHWLTCTTEKEMLQYSIVHLQHTALI